MVSMSDTERPFTPFHDFETASKFRYEGGRIFDKIGGHEAWPDDPGCVCIPLHAQYDPMSGHLFVQFQPDGTCSVHPGAGAIHT
jgi:hypothetical protein